MAGWSSSRFAFGGALSTSSQTTSGWGAWSSLAGNALPYSFASCDDDAPLPVVPQDGGVSDASAGDAGGAATGDAGSGEGGETGDGGSGSGASKSSGCGCGLPSGATNAAPLLLLLGVAARVRARRRA